MDEKDGEKVGRSGGLLYVGMAAILLGLSYMGFPGKKDEKPEYPLDSRAVPRSMLPPKLCNGGVRYADLDGDKDLESVYVWENPGGRKVELPMVLAADSSIAFPMLSEESYSPLEVPEKYCGTTSFLDYYGDGVMYSVYVHHGKNAIIAVPIVKPKKAGPRTYRI
jgi:hypothetical protein